MWTVCLYCMTKKLVFQAILLVILCATIVHAQSDSLFQSFHLSRLEINEKAMLILGGRAAGNILTGTYGNFKANGNAKTDRKFHFAGVKKIEEIILWQAPDSPFISPFSERQAVSGIRIAPNLPKINQCRPEKQGKFPENTHIGSIAAAST